MSVKQDLYAYSLSSLEAGWAWRVYDHEGGIVASGLEPSQTDAVAAVRRLIPAEPALAELADLSHTSKYTSRSQSGCATMANLD